MKTFHVNTPSMMKATTFGYGGGTNGMGMPIAQGGFEPYLSLFGAGGNFLASLRGSLAASVLSRLAGQLWR